MLKRTLLEVNPEAAKMWDVEENKRRGLLPPRAINAGSNKRARFRCLEFPEHVFDEKICNMTDRDDNSRGCKICRELKRKTFISFYDYCSKVKRFWDNDRNDGDPRNMSPFSSGNANFKCEKGHTFVKSIARFTQAPFCPYCKPTIESEKPELLVFWDYNKNKSINPTDISPFSSAPIKWRCPSCGYEWEMSPQRINETSKDRCPKCNYREKVKYGESFRSFNPAAAEYWDCEKNGEKTPDNMRPNSRSYININCPNNPNHSTRIKVCAIPHFPPYGCRHCEKPKITKDRSFAAIFPDLLKEYSANNHRDPYTISEISQTEVEWYCEKHNNYWMASPLARTRGEKKCEFCAKERKSFFSQLHPYLAEFYDEKKNSVPFDRITEKGNPEVMWKCEKGHSFPYRITNFSRKKKFDCPVCKGRIVIKGQTDLLSQFPQLAQEYDVKENGKTPDNISIYNTNPDTKWICPNGHRFNLAVKHRIENNGICAKCQRKSGSVIRARHQSNKTLLDQYPMLDSVWDYAKNKRRPEEYSSLHDEEIYAICPNKRHGSYQVMITTLIKNNYNCLACENKILVPGFNSLADLHPDWLQEWDYDDNYLLCDPRRILDNYSENVWWLCRDCGQIYKMSPNKYRDYDLREMTKCPYCKNIKPPKKYYA